MPKDSYRRTHVARHKREIELVAGGRNPSPYKPGGFWYEVDGDWQRWSERESFGLGRHYLHGVDLADCNVLLIDSLAKLDAFHASYATIYLYPGSHPSINWPAVARAYDGLEIAPYQWERRLAVDFMWYYGWDCASGVIWEPRNARVTYLREIIVKEAEYAS